jgi:hypothetical protein
MSHSVTFLSIFATSVSATPSFLGHHLKILIFLKSKIKKKKKNGGWRWLRATQWGVASRPPPLNGEDWEPEAASTVAGLAKERSPRLADKSLKL